MQNGKNCMTDKDIENSKGESAGMRTREMSLVDHGVFPGDEEKIKAYCRKEMGVEERRELFRCCISAAPGIEMLVFESITNKGSGYRTLIKRGFQIPAKEDDFYSYQRKALYDFYDWLRMTRRWKG